MEKKKIKAKYAGMLIEVVFFYFTFLTEGQKIEVQTLGSAEISLPIELRLDALGEQDKAIFIQSENGVGDCIWYRSCWF